MPRLEEELNCFGYYGFGGGYALAKGEDLGEEGGELYCSRECSLSKDCWERHKKRVFDALPDITGEFERRVMQAEITGQSMEALMGDWLEEFGIADPYLTVMAGNLEDGSYVGSGLQPKDRLEMSLTWPLEPRGGEA